jgi:hypothetical protein
MFVECQLVFEERREAAIGAKKEGKNNKEHS